jgi:uncharacterized membrane protein
MMVCNYFLWFLSYSFLGWIYESIYCSIAERKWVSRGFLNGPICPIYGAGAVLFLTTLRGLQNPIYIFFAGMILASLLEYITSWTLEKLFHARWWDYEQFFLNIHGRVCLMAGAVFGGFAVILIQWVHPWAERVTYQIPEPTRWVAAIVLFVILLADCMVTFLRLVQFANKLNEIQIAMNGFFREYRMQAGTILASFAEKFEGSRAYTERIRFLLQNWTFQEKRILRAFPKVRSQSFNEALQKVKQRILVEKRNTSGEKKESNQEPTETNK